MNWRNIKCVANTSTGAVPRPIMPCGPRQRLCLTFASYGGADGHRIGARIIAHRFMRDVV